MGEDPTTWRERFLILCGPGVLAGVTLGDWLSLLRDNSFSVDSPHWLRATAITFAATMNSAFRWFEEYWFGTRWKDVTVSPPVFVLGHWRSGTTHLHYLLSLDDRFAYPKFYEVHFPHTFLSTERYFSSLPGSLLPEHRPYDNVRWTLNVPDEDEFAMCVLGFISPYLSGVFPRRANHYDQFLTFRNNPQAADMWKASLQLLLQKLTLKYAKPIILKSPTHTCRIKLLLEMFPDAKFIHIRRDPYAVYQSFVHTNQKGLPFGRLQRTNEIDLSERVIRQYKNLYDAFFEERGLIGAGQFHEVAYEELERAPVSEMRKLYEALSLPDFARVEPTLRTYLETQSGYRKNVFGELATDVRRRIASEWSRCFEEWGYSV